MVTLNLTKVNPMAIKAIDDWLLEEIKKQAAYYGLTVEQYTQVASNAAAWQELIEQEERDE